MAEIINLRQARKQAARDAARRQGDENAMKHGRSRAQRQLEQQAAERARTALDGHRRDPGATD